MDHLAKEGEEGDDGVRRRRRGSDGMDRTVQEGKATAVEDHEVQTAALEFVLGETMPPEIFIEFIEMILPQWAHRGL